MLLQQAAVVGHLLVFVRLSQEVGPRGRTAAVLRRRPGGGQEHREHTEIGNKHTLYPGLILLDPHGQSVNLMFSIRLVIVCKCSHTHSVSALKDAHNSTACHFECV